MENWVFEQCTSNFYHLILTILSQSTFLVFLINWKLAICGGSCPWGPNLKLANMRRKKITPHKYLNFHFIKKKKNTVRNMCLRTSSISKGGLVTPNYFFGKFTTWNSLNIYKKTMPPIRARFLTMPPGSCPIITQFQNIKMIFIQKFHLPISFRNAWWPPFFFNKFTAWNFVNLYKKNDTISGSFLCWL